MAGRMAVTHDGRMWQAAGSPVATPFWECPGIRRNPAATRGMGNDRIIEISAREPAISLDRRVSVAPMMDYTDSRAFG
jgi:hypothetical protein